MVLYFGMDSMKFPTPTIGNAWLVANRYIYVAGQLSLLSFLSVSQTSRTHQRVTDLLTSEHTVVICKDHIPDHKILILF